MNQSGSNHGLRFSLRGLLAMVTFFAVACAALKFANEIWWEALSGISLLLFMAMAVVAFVGRGRMRAFAIGFTVCGLSYGAVLYSFGSFELDPNLGALPTTRLMRPVFQAIADKEDTDADGQPIGDDDPFSGSAGRGGYGGGFGGFGGQGGYGGYPDGAIFGENANTEVFMAIAHLLWAVIFGFVGGQFAGYVYARGERHADLAGRAAQRS